MSWPILAFKGLLVLSIANAHHVPGHRQDDEISNHALQFQRANVEKPIQNTNDDFGSHTLPLRTAVEFSPDKIVDELAEADKIGLRSAVEHRVPPTFGTFIEHESFWLEQVKPPLVKTGLVSPKVLCHLNTDAANREEPYSLLPSALPQHKCTHLIYGKAQIDEQNFTVLTNNQAAYEAAFELRKKDPALQILVSLEPPKNPDFLEIFSVRRYEYAPTFINSLVKFLRDNDFDGVEIDWTSATPLQLEILANEIKRSFLNQGLLLIVALNPEQRLVDELFSENVDLILLKAWHSKRSKNVAETPAPMNLVTDFVEEILNRGVPEDKLILGIPLFGWTYRLDSTKDIDFENNIPAVGYGIKGKYTQKVGKLGYFEVCEKQGKLWQYRRHETNGSYLVLGDHWIGYDDPITVKIKSAYAKSKGLAGISLDSLDLDDFQGICDNSWPMLNSVIRTLGLQDELKEPCNQPGLYSDPDHCSKFLSCSKGLLYRGICGGGRFYDSSRKRCVLANPEVCKSNLTTTHLDFASTNDILQRLQLRKDSERLEFDKDQVESPRVVCYMTSWSFYRKAEAQFVPEFLDTRLCSDIVYAYASLNPANLTIQPFDKWTDIENNFYGRVSGATGARIFLGLGGWTDSAGDKYSRMIKTRESRKKFIDSTLAYLEKYNFDGLSIEWLYPTCWQSDCNKSPMSDRENFVLLLDELRDEFDRQESPLALAITISGYKQVIDRAYDFTQISRLVDFMTVMTYDYHGAWESRTEHLAPLYPTPDEPFYNVEFTLEYIVKLGADRSKVIAGIPMYGQTYRLSSKEKTFLGSPAAGPGQAGEYTKQPGMLAYFEICDRINNKGWKTGPGPSAYYKTEFVTYEDEKSVSVKGKYLAANGFGGAAAWTVDLDDFINRCCHEPYPLLRSLNRALGRLLTPAAESKNCEKPELPSTPAPAKLTSHSDANSGDGHSHSHIHYHTTQSTTTVSTTWPTWTEKPSTTKTTSSPTTTTKKPTTWPTWTQEPSSTVNLPTTLLTDQPTKWTTKPNRLDVMNPATETPQTIECQSGSSSSDPTDCKGYYKCIQGKLRHRQCTNGLIWDNERQLCNWPNSVKCLVGSDTPVSDERPVINPPDTEDVINEGGVDKFEEENSSGCIDGKFYSSPDSCGHFHICVNGNKVRQACGPGLHWDQKKNSCDWAYKSDCLKKKKTTQIKKPITMDIKKKCTPGQYTADPNDCSKYYACIWGQAKPQMCPPGLHFREESGNCDWPDKARCQVSEQTSNDIPEEFSSISTEKSTTQFSTTEKRTTIARPITTSRSTTTKRPTTTTTTPRPPASSNNDIPPDQSSSHFKVVCYFTNWAWYRRGIGKYVPEDIDTNLCTHIVYGFAVLDYSNLIIKSHDTWADIDNRFYERVVAQKKKGVKVSLALGGWNDSLGDKYSRLVNDPAARQRFIQQAIQFIEKYGFEGLDLDWEYPACWQTECKSSHSSDKEGFASLLRELSAEFKPRGLLLSSAVSPSKVIINAGYDVPALAKYLDWIAVMCYDYHGQFDKKTGHIAPLYYYPGDDHDYFNANYSINYWISKGAPPSSLVMGMPVYGQSFSVNDPSRGMGLNVPASGGIPGEFTGASGNLAYYEICDRVERGGWKVVQDPKRRMGPYAYKGNQWVSYDDADMIRQKAQYVRDMGLGGGMIWALDFDDFRGRCSGGRNPLLSTLKEVLADPPNKHDRPIKVPKFGEILEVGKCPDKEAIDSVKPGGSNNHMEGVNHVEKPTSEVEQPAHGQGTNIHTEMNDDYKVVCYFTNWAWYRQEKGSKFLPEDIDPDLCTHIIYGFAVLNGETLTIRTHDAWADIDNKFYERVVAHKKNGKKVLIAIGGWNDSAGDKYSRLVNNPSSRHRFIENILQFIEKYGFDGLDLDWEYPKCWQVDCTKGPESDKPSFATFVEEISAVFKPKGLLLSSAVSPNKRVIDAGYDVAKISKYLDWISVMAYDYHGQWDKKTGHIAPLYERPDDWEQTFNANFSMNYWISVGAPPNKLVMGVPLYGQSFSLAESKNHGLNAPTYGGGEAGEGTRARGFLSYYEICERVQNRGWQVVRDPEHRIGPYAYRGDQWVGFDDTEQIKLKAELIKKLGLAGGMVWALDLDDFSNRCGCESYPLLKTLNRVLRNYPSGPDCSLKLGSLDKYPTDKQESNSDPSNISTESENVPSSESESNNEEASLDPTGGDCDGKIFAPHEFDCSKYYQCNHGKLQEMVCPSGTVWNVNTCDWPENSKCDASYSVPENINVSHENQTLEIQLPDEKPEENTDTEPGTSTTTENYEDETNQVSLVGDSNKKVVCYFTNWAWYRQGAGKFFPEDIDTNLCTHVVYAFAVLDSERLVIKPHDSWADLDNHFYERVVALKKKGIKVLIGIGGWNDSVGDKYSRLVNNLSARKRFIKDILQFIEKYDFDGLDLDWEYPVCWQVNCNRGPSSDKVSFGKFVRELSREFKPKGLLLSAAVSPSKQVIDAGYDVPTISKYLDWIAVMCYDYHGNWEKKTGHVSPLNYYPGDEFDYFNSNFTMRYWIKKGAQPSKLVMGVPFYGQSFTVPNAATKGLQVPATGPGQAGEFTKSGGFLAFYEICSKVKNNNWSVVKDPEGRIGPYAAKADQWVGYDDISSMARKAKLINELGLGGGMVWALDLDDFKNKCQCGKYPLLTALNKGLRGDGEQRADCT